jgi:hypothetical protein
MIGPPDKGSVFFLYMDVFLGLIATCSPVCPRSEASSVRGMVLF